MVVHQRRKPMTTYAYEDVLKQVQHLTPEEQIRLREDLEELISSRAKPKQLHNIMEFKGVAKDFWKDVDIQKYIEEERKSWGG
jgi:hypothetical protein